MRGRTGLLACALLVAAPPGAVAGQHAQQLADDCSAAGGDPVLCRGLAVGSRALMSDLAVAVGLGSEVGGSASNLGQRLGTTPRISVGVRVARVGMALPDLRSGAPEREASFAPSVLTADIAVGLFDGFRIMPTVGGFLSLDVVGRFSGVFLPSDEGFASDQTAYTAGARVGLLREGFTLPGVSVSVVRRFVNNIEYGRRSFLGDPVSFSVGPSVTSLRGTVGKDLLATELLLGVGLDLVSTEIAYEVQAESGPSFVFQRGSLDERRWIYFLSASRDMGVIFSLSLEAGFAGGFDSVIGYTSSFDPGRKTFFADAAFRLTI